MEDRGSQPKAKARAAREARLREALRANLKRRKRAANAVKAEEPRQDGADGRAAPADKS